MWFKVIWNDKPKERVPYGSAKDAVLTLQMVTNVDQSDKPPVYQLFWFWIWFLGK